MVGWFGSCCQFDFNPTRLTSLVNLETDEEREKLNHDVAKGSLREDARRAETLNGKNWSQWSQGFTQEETVGEWYGVRSTLCWLVFRFQGTKDAEGHDGSRLGLFIDMMVPVFSEESRGTKETR
ncbi:hypothetical protein ACRALDRAFT_208008 [Sodiomyces alcalophilus JCM 7366]|uniref:uncharacterized protein n=1 Tax=Sodiomyces alcalophilus JCM 7366 TaxID=591952 RepID=UPI0039B544F6